MAFLFRVSFFSGPTQPPVRSEMKIYRPKGRKTKGERSRGRQRLCKTLFYKQQRAEQDGFMFPSDVSEEKTGNKRKKYRAVFWLGSLETISWFHSGPWNTVYKLFLPLPTPANLPPSSSRRSSPAATIYSSSSHVECSAAWILSLSASRRLQVWRASHRPTPHVSLTFVSTVPQTSLQSSTM